jgi:hypothetical protein
MYKTIISPVVLYGCETWPQTFENRLFRRIFEPRRVEVSDVGENCIMRSFVTCAPHQI